MPLRSVRTDRRSARTWNEQAAPRTQSCSAPTNGDLNSRRQGPALRGCGASAPEWTSSLGGRATIVPGTAEGDEFVVPAGYDVGGPVLVDRATSRGTVRISRSRSLDSGRLGRWTTASTALPASFTRRARHTILSTGSSMVTIRIGRRGTPTGCAIFPSFRSFSEPLLFGASWCGFLSRSIRSTRRRARIPHGRSGTRGGFSSISRRRPPSHRSADRGACPRSRRFRPSAMNRRANISCPDATGRP
jgi:hypothetical protein